MANEPSRTGNGCTESPFKFLLTSMFANVLLIKANHMDKSRVKVGRTIELQGREYNSSRPLPGAICTASLYQASVPKVFSSTALLYFPPSWSCLMSCLSGSQPSSSGALWCLGSHSPLASGTSWLSHPCPAQVDVWISLATLNLPFLGLWWRHCPLRTCLLCQSLRSSVLSKVFNWKPLNP